MEILKLVGIVWLCLLFLTCLGMVVGVIIERKFNESHPIKKWWRKHILAPDPDDNNWKNFAG